MRTTPNLQALLTIRYVKNELQLRLVWCMTGLTMGEYNSEGRKRSKEEKVILVTHLGDQMICETIPQSVFMGTSYKTKEQEIGV